MNPENKNPFGVPDYQNVKSLQRRLVSLKELIDKSKRCGINCENEDAACFAMAEFLNNFEKEFLTPPPAGALQTKD